MVRLWRRPLSPADGRVQNFRDLRESEIAQQSLARNSAVSVIRPKVRERAAGTNHRVEQAAGGVPVAKIEAVRKNALDAQMVSEGAHHVIKSLADEHHFRARGYDFLELFNARQLQPRLQKILEELLAQKIEAVAALMSQNSMQQSRGKNTVCGIEEGSCNGENAHRSSTGPPAEEALRVPREEANRAN